MRRESVGIAGVPMLAAAGRVPLATALGARHARPRPRPTRDRRTGTTAGPARDHKLNVITTTSCARGVVVMKSPFTSTLMNIRRGTLKVPLNICKRFF